MNNRVLTALAVLALGVVLFWPSGSSKKVESLYKEGEALYAKKDYEGAIEKYKEALEESNKPMVKTEVIDKDFYTLAQFKIAVCWSKMAEDTGDLNHYEEATRIIEEIFPNAIVPRHMEGLTYLWANVLYKQEQYELSEPKFMELIENFPNSQFVENAWYAIGQLNYKLQRFDATRQAFKEVLDGFPNSEFKDDSQHLIAQSFLDEENYEQAYQEFDKLATEEFKNYPDLQAEAMYKASYCTSQLNRFEDAIGRYTNFITKFPNSKYVTAAYFDSGAIYARQKDYDNARVNYELAIQNTDDKNVQSEIQTAIGRTYFDEGDYSNAIDAYQVLLDEYPESVFISEAKLGIADSHFRLESWTDASTAYQRILDEHADESELTPYVTYQLGETYYKLATKQRNTGEEDQATQNLETALGWYQKAVDEFPSDPVAPHALYGAIWTLNDLGRTEELEKVAREFIDKNKEDPELDILAAEVQLKFADMQFNDFKQYLKAAAEYANLWTFMDLPKFHLIKLVGKFQEGRAYYEASKPAEDDADGAYDQELLEKSVVAYNAAVEKFKDDAFLGGIEEGRYDDFPERIGQVEGCQLNQALAHEKLEQWPEARELYMVIREDSDNYQRAQLLVAQSYINEGDSQSAIAHYDKIMPSLDADNQSLAAIKLADLLRSDEQYQKAAVQYTKVVEGNPTGEWADDAQYLVGLCYYQAADGDVAVLDQSISAFNDMLSNYGDSPNLVEAYYGLVLAYRDKAQAGDDTQWANVTAFADEAYQKFSDSDEEKILKALSHIDLVKASAIEKQGIESEEQRSELMASLQRIADNEGAPVDSRSRAQLKIGHLAYGANDYDTAIVEYQKLQQNYPTADTDVLVNGLYQLGVCYYQRGNNETDPQAKQLAFQNASSTAKKVLDQDVSPENNISAAYTIGLAKEALGDSNGAIAAYNIATSFEGQTDDAGRIDLIFQSHSRLAELYSNTGKDAQAVSEYQYIIDNTEDTNLKGSSYFAMGYALDEKLKQYDDALLAYQNAVQTTDNRVLQAQAYYRIGLIYEDRMNDGENGLTAYNTLINDYGKESDQNIQSMVADAQLRKSDLLKQLGRLDDAIAEAVEALRVAESNPSTPMTQKVSAQYNIGGLYFDKARTLFSDVPGTDLAPYIQAMRDSGAAFSEVETVAGDLSKLDKSLVPYAQNALFQSGQIYYSLGSASKNKEDLTNAIVPLQKFVSYADKEVFPASAELSNAVQTSLVYVSTAQFELGRVQLGEDEGISDAVQGYFADSAVTFQSLAKRFPSAKDAPTWQFQAGDAYYASNQYEEAVGEYEKVYKNFPKSATAPEAVYAISTCYSYLAEVAKNDENEAENEKWLGKLFDTNQILADSYPTTPYAANAFVNLGNKFYNQGSAPDIEASERISLYSQAIERYAQALKVPGISQETKTDADMYLRETQTALAYYEYKNAETVLSRARTALTDEIPDKTNEAIMAYQAIIDKYPKTKYADLSFLQIADSYLLIADSSKGAEAQEKYQKAIKAYDELWTKYQTAPPSDAQVSQAVKRAQQQIGVISNYLTDQKKRGQ